jgi:hypothetical protein
VKYHRITVSVLVPVGEGGYGATPEIAAQWLKESIHDDMGLGSCAGLVADERIESISMEPDVACSTCNAPSCYAEDVQNGVCRYCR